MQVVHIVHMFRGGVGGVSIRGSMSVIVQGQRGVLLRLAPSRLETPPIAFMRREETASTRSLLNTAKMMEENAMLWKLKEMEYVEKIADKISNISVSGNGVLIEQLKQIFVPQK